MDIVVSKFMQACSVPFKIPVKIGVKLALRHQWIQTVSMDGRDFRVPEQMSPADVINLFRGAYEREEIAVLRKYFAPAARLVEIGANIGVVSRIAYEEKLAPGGSMICVEPNPATFPFLSRNILEVPGKAISFRNVAVGIINGSGPRAEFRQRNNLSSGLTRHLKYTPDAEAIQVGIQPLSEIIKDVAGPYGLICDAEGAEIEMIEREPDALAHCNQAMFEFHDPDLTGLPETPDIMIQKLEKLGLILRARIDNSCYFSRE